MHRRRVSAVKIIIRSGSEMTKIESDKESQWGVWDMVGLDKRRGAVQ